MKKSLLTLLLFVLSIAEADAAIAFRAASFAALRTANISYRDSGKLASAANGNISPELHSEELNALLLCLVEQHDNVAISFPPGWNELYSLSSSANHRASAYYKRSAATEVNPLITHPGGNSIIARCSVFRGADAYNPLDVAYAAQYAASSTHVVSGSLSTLTAKDMLLYAMHVANNPTVAADPADSVGVHWDREYYSSTPLGLHAALGFYKSSKNAPGMVGPFTATLSTASENHGVLMALIAGSRLSIPLPAGTVAGDVMVAAIATTPNTATITAPSGWTLIQAVVQPAATKNRLSTYFRVATASEASSFAWKFSGAHAGAVGGIASYSGVDNASPIDVSAGMVTAKLLTHAAPGLTTTAANDLLLTVHEYASAGSFTPPTGMTERIDIATRRNNRGGLTLGMNELSLGVAGATGSKTATANANADTGSTVSIALRALMSAPHHLRIEHYGGACNGTSAPAQIILKACANAACIAPYYIASDVTGISLLPVGAGYTWAPTNPQTLLAASGGVNEGITLARGTSGTAVLAISGTPSPAPDYAYECYNSNTGTSGDCNLTFSSDTFTSNILDHISDTRQVVVLTSCNGTFANTSRQIKLWSTYINPATGSIQGSVVGGTGNADCATGFVALSASSIAPTVLGLSFGSGATPQTLFSLCYPDAGQVQVNARYEGSAAAGDAGTVITGYDRFIAAPDHYTLYGINCVDGCSVSANPGATDAVGAAFMKAGKPFSLTVAAYNANGMVTPNFGRESAPESVNLTATMIADPDLSTAGAVSGAFGAYVGGIATGNAFTFDEVGIMSLSAGLASSSYLGSGLKEVTNPSSGNIGRFIPDHFEVMPDVLNPVRARADLPQRIAIATGTDAPSTAIDVDDTAGFNVGSKVRIPGAGLAGAAFTATITAVNHANLILYLDNAIEANLDGGENVIEEWGGYMGERMDIQFDLMAVDHDGKITRNYQGVYAKLVPGAPGNPLNFGAVDAGVSLSARLDTSIAATGGFSGGVASIVAPLAFSRNAIPDGPYVALKIGIAPMAAESDGVRMGSYDLNVDGAFDHCSIMEPLVQGVTLVRHGRTRISNAYGSELLSLELPVTVQYWNGMFYTRGVDDSISQVTVSLGNYSANLNTGETTLTQPTIARGAGRIGLSAPGGGNHGSVDVTGASPAYLPGNSLRATFGVYKGNNMFIYTRENY